MITGMAVRIYGELLDVASSAWAMAYHLPRGALSVDVESVFLRREHAFRVRLSCIPVAVGVVSRRPGRRGCESG